MANLKFWVLFLFFWGAGPSGAQQLPDSAPQPQERFHLRSQPDLQLNDEHTVPVDISQGTPFNSLKKENKNEFVLAPIPFLNPSQGWGLALIGQYIFTLKEDRSPPSVVGGGAFYTEKKSSGGALAYSGKLANDQWRIGLLTGKAVIFYDFYGVGYNQNKQDIAIPLRQEIEFAGLRLMKQIGRKVFVGLELVGADIKTSIEADPNNFPNNSISEIVVASNFVSPNFRVERDTRNDTFYPTSGGLVDIHAEFHNQSFHDKFTYQAYKIAWNQYWAIADFDVLALRLMTRQSYGDVPFYSLSMFGRAGDLRGYESGRYRDKMMWAAQVELRHRFSDRWGAVVFGGAGQVAADVSEFSHAPYLGSGGLGLRFRIANQNPVDFRFDTAYGDQQLSYYFGVGQAF